MMPNTSVSPAAIRKSMTPSCSPLRICSRTRTGVNPGALPLHRAVLVVRILVALEHGLLDAHLDVAARGGYRLQEVEILDGEVIHVVLVRAARRLVVGLPHRG